MLQLAREHHDPVPAADESEPLRVVEDGALCVGVVLCWWAVVSCIYNDGGQMKWLAGIVAVSSSNKISME